MHSVRLALMLAARQTTTLQHLVRTASLCSTASSSTTSIATPTSSVVPDNADYFRQLISDVVDDDESPIEDVQPALPVRSRTLTPYVNESETLQQLVRLGVALWKVEKDKDVSARLIAADFVEDVQPRLLWLKDCGVCDRDLGKVITANPRLLLTSLQDLQSRVGYLQSKNFTEASVTRILSNAPRFLTMTTREADRQLGHLQRKFHLTGDELRLTVTRLPKLITWNRKFVENIRTTVDAFLGFTDAEQKKLLITTPKIYLSNSGNLRKIFDYVHNEMSISHEAIVEWPSILRTRLFIIKQRHLFLRHIGRAQYDQTKPNYVSLETLVSCDDAKFCENVAKVPVRDFNDFQKTL